MSKIIERIKHWSEVFNLPIKEEEGFPDPSRVSLSLKLIKEEYEETVSACDEGNFKETKDGLGDVLWTTVRAMFEMGMNPEEIIAKIYESNMSKADDNQLQAEITKADYLNKGIETYYVENKGKFLTYRLSDNKLLKSSTNFKEPEL